MDILVWLNFFYLTPEVGMYREGLRCTLVVLLLGFVVATAAAAELNYMDAARFKGLCSSKAPMLLADIQKPHDFKKHHFFAAVETDAYPVKSASDKAKLDVIRQMFQKTGNDVILIGPRGGPASKRAANALIEQGIPADKVFILEGGVKKWPDQEMLLDVAGGCA